MKVNGRINTSFVRRTFSEQTRFAELRRDGVTLYSDSVFISDEARTTSLYNFVDNMRLLYGIPPFNPGPKDIPDMRLLYGIPPFNPGPRDIPDMRLLYGIPPFNPGNDIRPLYGIPRHNGFDIRPLYGIPWA